MKKMTELIKQYWMRMIESEFTDHRLDRNLKVMNWIGVVIALIGGVMTLMNVIQHKGFVTLTTLLIFLAGLGISYSVRVMRSRKIAIGAALFVCVVVFSYYAVSGVNDGFAILWIIVVPLGFNYFGGVSYAVILSLYYELLLIVLFYTPLRAHMAKHYTETFMNRFPVLYICIILINSVAMYHYHFSTLYRIENEKKLREAAEAAVAAEKVKSRFLAQMSHEIRTPINAVLGMNEMILREAEDGNILEYAESIQGAGETLLYLINSILDFSKLEDDKMELVPVRYKTADMVRRLVNFVSESARKKSLTFTVDVDETLPAVLQGDDMRIAQVVTNLLSNAVKYTEKGRVTLTIRDAGRAGDTVKLYVSVQDTGIGIRREDMEKLFSPFERLDEQRNRYIEGTGLGMSIVTRLLRLMDSKIEVESVYGEGSTFFFFIDQTIVDAAPIGKYRHRHEDVEREQKKHIFAPDAKVLVVDDNEMNCKVAKSLLKLNGIVPDIAFSGAEAIGMMREQNYHVVFLDHMMPKMDGIETLRKLKAEKLTPEGTVIVALTANAVAGAREKYLNAGFDDYLSKPIEIDDLEGLLHRHLPSELVTWRAAGRRACAPAQEDAASSAQEKPPAETGLPESVEASLEKTGLAVEEGIRYCGGDAELYAELLDDYATGFPDKARALEAQFTQKDWRSYEIAVHTLKSTYKTMGAMELFRDAKMLNDAAKCRNTEYIEENHALFLKNALLLADKLRAIKDSQ